MENWNGLREKYDEALYSMHKQTILYLKRKSIQILNNRYYKKKEQKIYTFFL